LDKIKDFLKKSKIISVINAKIKCLLLKNQYKNIVDRYENMEQKYSLKELMLQKGFTEEWSESLEEKIINIYFYGKDEFQDKSGFIQALKKFGNFKYFIKDDGTYGRYSEDDYYFGTSGKKLNTDHLISSIEKQIFNNSKPDLVFMQALGKTYEVERLEVFKKKHDIKFINIYLDDRLVYEINTPALEKYNFWAIGLNSIIDLGKPQVNPILTF